MRRTTHYLMGAAVVVPIALMVPPACAIGSIWFGAVGGGLPDYLDKRATTRHFLRHRGASHSFLTLLASSLVVGFVLSALSTGLGPTNLPADYVWPWTLAFALGVLSHLLGDACTIAGIQPWLPFVRWRFWLLPKLLRGKSDGSVNSIAIAFSVAILAAGLAIAVLVRLPA